MYYTFVYRIKTELEPNSRVIKNLLYTPPKTNAAVAGRFSKPTLLGRFAKPTYNGWAMYVAFFFILPL
jgi:hypothetical protein